MVNTVLGPSILSETSADLLWGGGGGARASWNPPPRGASRASFRVPPSIAGVQGIICSTAVTLTSHDAAPPAAHCQGIAGLHMERLPPPGHGRSDRLIATAACERRHSDVQ